jgi:general secretion pathway protein D
MKIPILKYLFGQETKERSTTEVVFAITPHIIRSNEVTDENLKMVDLGSGSTVTYRKGPESVTAQTAPQPADVRPQGAPAPASQPHTP